MPASRIATRLTALISRFRRDRRGNIAVIFAFALMPVLSAIGCATDYSLAMRMKSKMQSAADAAAVASISQGSAGYLAATKMTTDGSVSVGVTDATNIFKGNVPAIGNGYTGDPLKTLPTVIKTGSKLTSVVTFTAQVPTVFMQVAGFSALTISGSSSASASLPLYLDFYLTLDVSGSMGLPSTTAEALRMQAINPDNWVQYRTGCTLACHFAPQKSACVDPPVTAPAAPAANPPTNSNYSQQYNTNNYCMGYVYSRLSQAALKNLINSASTKAVPKQVPGLPVAMLPGLNTALDGSPNSLITGNTSSLPYSLPAATSCPTEGTDACIQLRLDAVGYAVTHLFQTAQQDEKITGQFRIGLYPFIQSLNANYFPLTTTFNGSASTPGTINYAAANLAQLLDTNTDANLGSGGTHIDTALNSMNTLITSVGDGSAFNKTLPYVFLVTDGAQDPQIKGVPNGGWSGSNWATTIDNQGTTVPAPPCANLKKRGIIVSVLYIPYQTISPVNASFANDEDDHANSNIPYIPASLQGCASSGFFYTANSPSEIQDSLTKMFEHALVVAHITN